MLADWLVLCACTIDMTVAVLCCGAAVGCGASPNYWVLIACRMLVGVGEASFVALAAPFIGETQQLLRLQLYWLEYPGGCQ